MLYFTIGKPHRLPKKVLENVMKVSVDYLKLDDADFEVEIEFVKNIPAQGYAEIDGEVADYRIQINKDSAYRTEDMIMTIIHEMVHVAQYFRKHYIPGEGKKLSKWKGKSVDLPYSKQPWERQAFRLEKTIFKKYLEQYG